MVEREHGGELHLLVNNAGGSWRGGFAETGWENVERHMKLNFEAPVRLTEALLPLLRATAAKHAPAATAGKRPPTAIVNVASTAGRVSRPRAGAYSASKFALAGWSDSLAAEESAHGVHVGLVLPGFIAHRGLPGDRAAASRCCDGRLEPDKVAEAIVEVRAGRQGRAVRAAAYYSVGDGGAGRSAPAAPTWRRRRDVTTATRPKRTTPSI